MIKIGLVGESPNDTQSIQNLLGEEYTSSDYEFYFLLDRINGSQLDSQKTKRFLRIEFENKNPDLVIFIRDLDSILPNKLKKAERQLYFSSSNSVVDKKGIYLLNIYEIEALILADIETFNRIYNCEIPLIENPMNIEEPKEFLRSKAKNYTESDNPDIFKAIEFQKMFNCSYFKDFIKKLNKTIVHLNNHSS